MTPSDVLAWVATIALSAIGVAFAGFIVFVLVGGMVSMIADFWRENRPAARVEDRAAPEVVERSGDCPEAGDKFCEMKGCAILGSCQHPDRRAA